MGSAALAWEAKREGRPLEAVKAFSCPQWNDGFRPDSGPSRGDPCRRALRPTQASKAAVCYVRSTSTPAERERQSAQLNSARLSTALRMRWARLKTLGLDPTQALHGR